MPATVTTKELVSGTSDEDLDREIALRIQAGAIRAWAGEEDGETYLYTEWNVIGDQ